MAMNALPPAQDEPRDAHLSRLYRESGGPEPAADLDRSILAAAHREVHARPRPTRSLLWQWRVPVSIAAVLVISASLVTLMVEEGGERLSEPTRATSKAVPGEAAPAPSAPSAPVSPAPSVTADVAAGPDEPRLTPERKDASKTEDARSATPGRAPEAPAVAAGATRTPPATHPPADQALVAPPPKAAGARVETETRPAPRQEAAVPLPPEATLRDDVSGDGPAGRLQSAPRSDLAEDSGAQPRAKSSLGVRGFVDMSEPAKQSAGAAIESPDRSSAGSVRAGPAEPEAGQNRRAREGGELAGAQLAPAPPAKTAPRAAAKPAAKPAPTPRGAALARDLVDQPPEKWLERLEQLRREDRQSDAAELLAEFRRRFPEYPVPARLR